MRRSWALFTALPWLLPGCVSTVDIYQVDVEISLPCAPWADAGAPTGSGDLYRVQLYRATPGTGCEGGAILCYPQVAPLTAQMACGEVTAVSMEVGTFPEILGVRVLSPDDQVGYGFVEALKADTYAAWISPEVSAEAVDEPWCSQVASCMLAPQSDTFFYGDPDDAAAEACAAGAPVVTTSPTPSAPSPSPGDATQTATAQTPSATP